MSEYIKGRPVPPLPFYIEALEQTPDIAAGETLHIWDCATGPNAAVTIGLLEVLAASRFSHTPIVIHATDNNAAIIAAAQNCFNNRFPEKSLPSNIKVAFQQAAAEVGPPSLPEGEKLSLVLVGNALHWFDRPRFYDVVRQQSKADALLVAWTHPITPKAPNHPAIEEKLIAFSHELSKHETSESRAYVSSANGYSALDWPFASPVKFAEHSMHKGMDITKLGYYWDAHFPRAANKTFGRSLATILKSTWGDPQCPKPFMWAMSIRAARIGSYTPLA